MAKGIGDPWHITLKMAELESFIFQRKIEKLCLKSPAMRHQHLKQCLKLAREEEYEDSADAIMRILHH